MIWAIARRPVGPQILVALLTGLAGCQSPPPVGNEPSGDEVREVIALEPGTTQERSISGEAVDCYELAAKADDFLHVDVEQFRVDLDVRLSDPEGREVLLVDNLTGAAGAESVFAIAHATGSYRLEVKPLNRTDFGRYRIISSPLHPYSERDQILAEAARLLYGPAEDGDGSGSSEDQARRLEKALALFISADEPRQVALTMQRLSNLLESEDRPRAMKYLELALDIMEPQWHNDTAPFLNSLARIYRESALSDRVSDCSSRALETARAVGDRNEEGVALNGLALSYQAEGKPWEALVFFTKSLEIWRELGNHGHEATAQFNIGNVYGLLGKFADSLDANQKAMALYRQAGEHGREADVLAAIAGTHMEQASLEEDSENEDSAQQRYLRQASEEADRAVDLADRHGTAKIRLRVLERRGTVYFRRGFLDQAQATYEQALKLAQDLHQNVMEAIVLNSLGELHAARGDRRRALESHAMALRIFTKMQERVGQCYTQFLIAKAQYRFGNLFSAKVAITKALSTTEEVRFASKSADFRSSYFASIRERFELLIQILISLNSQYDGQGYDVAAFEVSERGRGRSLLDLLNEAQGRRRLNAALNRDKEAKLDQQIARIQGALEAALDPAEKTDLEEKLDGILREKAMIPIRSDELQGASLEASVVSLQEIESRLLDDNTLLLAYSLGRRHSYLMAVDNHSLTIHRLAGRATLERTAKSFGNALSNRRSNTQATLTARSLGNLLLGPVAETLGGKRLLIVAEGQLLSIPFSALEVPSPDSEKDQSTGYSPIVLSHEVVTIPSASILAALRDKTAHRQPAPKLLAVMADPVFERSDKRLPQAEDSGASNPPVRFQRLEWSREEAEAILGLVPEGLSFKALDCEATRDVVTSGQLRPYRILHFATHALVDSERPELSGLLFSLHDAQGRALEGYLRSYEIPHLELPADLVVLSACSTGLGKRVPGEGLVGLTQAFLNAGAARLVVSLWDVHDRATAALMKEFYRGMLENRLPPSAALAEAQRKMITRKDVFRQPFYWAGFVIEGEWRGMDLEGFD